MKSKNVDKKEPAIQTKEISPDQYVNSLPDDRKEAITQIRKIILKNVPKGFQERTLGKLTTNHCFTIHLKSL